MTFKAFASQGFASQEAGNTPQDWSLTVRKPQYLWFGCDDKLHRISVFLAEGVQTPIHDKLMPRGLDNQAGFWSGHLGHQHQLVIGFVPCLQHKALHHKAWHHKASI